MDERRPNRYAPPPPFFVTRCPTLFPLVASFFVKMLSKGAADSSGSSRTVKKRVALGRKCLEYIAGSTEDAKLLAKHVAGFDNWTTDEILGRFKALPGKECATKQVKKVETFLPLNFQPGSTHTGARKESTEKRSGIPKSVPSCPPRR